jgi:uncharacterized membrane protein YccC
MGEEGMDYVLQAIGLGFVGCIIGGLFVIGMMRLLEALLERRARKEMLEQEKRTRAEQEAQAKKRAAFRVISGDGGEGH